MHNRKNWSIFVVVFLAIILAAAVVSAEILPVEPGTCVITDGGFSGCLLNTQSTCQVAGSFCVGP
jgi:hypothetical protein